MIPQNKYKTKCWNQSHKGQDILASRTKKLDSTLTIMQLHNVLKLHPPALIKANIFQTPWAQFVRQAFCNKLLELPETSKLILSSPLMLGPWHTTPTVGGKSIALLTQRSCYTGAMKSLLASAFFLSLHFTQNQTSSVHSHLHGNHHHLLSLLYVSRSPPLLGG